MKHRRHIFPDFNYSPLEVGGVNDGRELIPSPDDGNSLADSEITSKFSESTSLSDLPGINSGGEDYIVTEVVESNDGDSYSGDLNSDGQFDGKGIMIYAVGDVYEV